MQTKISNDLLKKCETAVARREANGETVAKPRIYPRRADGSHCDIHVKVSAEEQDDVQSVRNPYCLSSRSSSKFAGPQSFSVHCLGVQEEEEDRVRDHEDDDGEGNENANTEENAFDRNVCYIDQNSGMHQDLHAHQRGKMMEKCTDAKETDFDTQEEQRNLGQQDIDDKDNDFTGGEETSIGAWKNEEAIHTHETNSHWSSTLHFEERVATLKRKLALATGGAGAEKLEQISGKLIRYVHEAMHKQQSNRAGNLSHPLTLFEEAAKVEIRTE